MKKQKIKPKNKATYRLEFDKKSPEHLMITHAYQLSGFSDKGVGTAEFLKFMAVEFVLRLQEAEMKEFEEQQTKSVEETNVEV